MAILKKEEVTKEYYDKLNEEYRRLLDVERPQVQEELAAAKQQGDLSENADYDVARDKQAAIESRIQELESILKNVQVATTKKVKTKLSKITSFCTVVVYDTVDECDYTYHLIGDQGGDPQLGKITVASSLGSALLGKSVDDEVEVVCADGSSYKVIVKEITSLQI